MTDTAMRALSLWAGALVDIDGTIPAMVQHAEDGDLVRVILRDGSRTVLDVYPARLTVVPLPPGSWTHSTCGTVIRQRGERTSHCARCHVTFEGLTLFDAHQILDAVTGRVTCRKPSAMKFRGQRLRLVDGSWRGPKLEAGAFE